MKEDEHKVSSMVTRTRLYYQATGIFLFAFIKSLFINLNKVLLFRSGIHFRVCSTLLPVEFPLTSRFDVSSAYAEGQTVAILQLNFTQFFTVFVLFKMVSLVFQ